MFGNWKIIKNGLYGFVVKNVKDCQEEYHFACESNGWVTCVNPKNGSAKCMNAMGLEVGMPLKVDSESTQKMERMDCLKQKSKSEGLTEAEKTELLILAGLISEPESTLIA